MNEEKHYNYLEAYIRDGFADHYGLEPIVFNWNNVNRVDPIEQVPFLVPGAEEASRKRGMPVMKVHVCCAEHGHFNQVMQDPPTQHDGYCYHCITREMNRILSLRIIRDHNFMKEMRK